MKKIILIGGGTFNPIANHLSLAAPAFGTSVDTIKRLMSENSDFDEYKIITTKTKMADNNSSIVSNDDLSAYVDELVEDKDVAGIVFNAAVCDFKVNGGSFHGERKSSAQNLSITLIPSDKIIKNIRIKRPDIFLVGFKTTTNKDVNQQFEVGLERMKKNKCNLMFCNDTITRSNLTITAEETIYGQSNDREVSLKTLCDLMGKRLSGTYNKTQLVKMKNVDITTPFFGMSDLTTVLMDLKNLGVFISNNGNGFTPGHFCMKVSLDSVKSYLNNNGIDPSVWFADDETLGFGFISSLRKSDHNQFVKEGLGLVVPLISGDSICFGQKKPSVGARTQALLLAKNPGYRYIFHTHNPINDRVRDKFNIVEQFDFQCGSLECGINTLGGLKQYGSSEDILAVYLEKHGFNILVKDTYKLTSKVRAFFIENTHVKSKVM